MRFSVAWLPFTYDAWGVFILDESTNRGVIPAYYCSGNNSRQLAEEHASWLEFEHYQAESK